MLDSAKATTPFPFPIGSIIDGQWVVTRSWKKGGMGYVFPVERVSLPGRLRALKILRPDLHPDVQNVRDSLAMFDQEQALACELAEDKDSFVDIIDRGTTIVLATRNGQAIELKLPYYVMEWVHGCGLDLLIHHYFNEKKQKNTYPDWEVVGLIALLLANAVRSAHEKNIVHRDIKPNNVYVENVKNRSLNVKLIDFGVAKRVGDKTTRGTGTTEYNPPEVLDPGALGIEEPCRETSASDIYSLGLVLYELLGAGRAFDAVGHEGWKLAHLEGRPRRLSELRPDVPRAIDDLLFGMLAKDPARRPAADIVVEVLSDFVKQIGANGATQTLALVTVLRREATRRAERKLQSNAKDPTTLGGEREHVTSQVFFTRDAPERDSVPGSPLDAAGRPAVGDVVLDVRAPSEGVEPSSNLSPAITKAPAISPSVEEAEQLYTSMARVFEDALDDNEFVVSPFEAEWELREQLRRDAEARLQEELEIRALLESDQQDPPRVGATSREPEPPTLPSETLAAKRGLVSRKARAVAFLALLTTLSILALLAVWYRSAHARPRVERGPRGVESLVAVDGDHVRQPAFQN